MLENQFQLFQAQLRNKLCFVTLRTAFQYCSRQGRFRERHGRDQTREKRNDSRRQADSAVYRRRIAAEEDGIDSERMKSCREPRQRDTIEILSGRGC